MGIGTLTTVGKNEALDALVSTNTTLYIGLLDSGIEEIGAGSGGTPYARKSIAFDAAAAGVKASNAVVTFDNGGATDWGATLDEWAIYDASTSGNAIASGLLDATRNLSIADAVVVFDSGSIVLTFE